MMNCYVSAPVSGRLGFGRMPLQRALDQMAAELYQQPSGAGLKLRMDVKESDAAYQVVAELPGLSEQDVEITYDDGVLSLRGEKKLARDDKGETWHITERSQGSFVRQLSLPDTVDADRIEAKFALGVLTVTLPKKPEEQSKARKITIKAS